MYVFYLLNKYTCMLVVYGKTFVGTEVRPRTHYPRCLTENTWSSEKSFYLPPNHQVLTQELHATLVVMVNSGSIQSMYS